MCHPVVSHIPAQCLAGPTLDTCGIARSRQGDLSRVQVQGLSVEHSPVHPRSQDAVCGVLRVSHLVCSAWAACRYRTSTAGIWICSMACCLTVLHLCTISSMSLQLLQCRTPRLAQDGVPGITRRQLQISLRTTHTNRRIEEGTLL